MNLTENTKVRIRVPKHLYESIQEELGKMEEKKHEDSMEEGNYDPENTVEEGEEMKEYVGMNAAEMQAMELAGQILAAVAAGTGLTAGIVNLAKKVKAAINPSKSSDAEAPKAPVEELEEVLNFETLMEAVKAASKKKVADKKAADKKIADKKAADKKIADKKAADKKAADEKAAAAKKKAEAAKKK
jgi:hypothetical protein